MKRTALARRTPLRTTSQLKRTPMRRKARRPRKPSDIDRPYLAWLRLQRCAMCDAPPPNSAHHHSMKQRGRGQKAPDRYAFTLCEPWCHTGGLHMLAGRFKGWNRERLRDWQDEQVAKYRGRWEREQAANGNAGQDAAAVF